MTDINQCQKAREVKFHLYRNDNIPTLSAFYLNLQAMINKAKK